MSKTLIFWRLVGRVKGAGIEIIIGLRWAEFMFEKFSKWFANNCEHKI